VVGSVGLGQSVPRMGAWDSLSRSTVEDSRQDDDLRFNVRLLETNDNPGTGTPAQATMQIRREDV
jgi:hypothetical protein